MKLEVHFQKLTGAWIYISFTNAIITHLIANLSGNKCHKNRNK